MCHSAIEFVDHLFTQCSFVRQIWGYFCRLLHLSEPPLSMINLWDSWRPLVRSSMREMGDLVVKALIQNIWHAKNDCIFNAIVVPTHVIILKIICMLLSWFSTVTEGAQEKLKDSMTTIRCCLEFHRPRAEESSGVLTSEETLGPSMGQNTVVGARRMALFLHVLMLVFFKIVPPHLVVLDYHFYLFLYFLQNVVIFFLIEVVYPLFKKTILLLYLHKN